MVASLASLSHTHTLSFSLNSQWIPSDGDMFVLRFLVHRFCLPILVTRLSSFADVLETEKRIHERKKKQWKVNQNRRRCRRRRISVALLCATFYGEIRRSADTRTMPIDAKELSTRLRWLIRCTFLYGKCMLTLHFFRLGVNQMEKVSMRHLNSSINWV